MDRILRAEIVAQVKRGMMDALEGGQRKMADSQRAVRTVPDVHPSWLKAYGDRLPRTRAEVAADGKRTKGKQMGLSTAQDSQDDRGQHQEFMK